MSRPPSQPPDDALLAQFRTELEHALPVLTAVLRADPSSIAPSVQSERTMQSFKSAARALGIAEVAAFVDAFERALASVSGLAPPAGAAALQVLRAALAYLSQVLRAHALPRFVAATTAELTALTRALEAVHAARDPKRHNHDEQPSDGAMLELFRAEVEHCTKALSDGVLLLDTRGAAAAPWEALMRAAHSLKGAARIVKLPEVAQLAHVLEECLLLLHSSDKPPTSPCHRRPAPGDRRPAERGQRSCATACRADARRSRPTAAAVRTRIGALAERRFTSAPPSTLASAPPPKDTKPAAAAPPPRLSLVQPALPAEVVLEQLGTPDTVLVPVGASQAPTPTPSLSRRPPPLRRPAPWSHPAPRRRRSPSASCASRQTASTA